MSCNSFITWQSFCIHMSVSCEMLCLVLISWSFRTVMLSLWNIRHGRTIILRFPCLCTAQGFFPWAWTSSELRVRASLLCLLAPCTGAGPGCFEEWPFNWSRPAELAGIGPGNWFLTQSGLLLLVDCCSTLSLNTVVCVIHPRQRLPGYVKVGSCLCHIGRM